VGGALADALADAVRGTGVRRIAAVMLGDNDAARALALRIGRRLAGGAPSAVEDVIRGGVRELTAGRAG
jgi:L-amino acid N-acyltransferase YncA